MKPSTLAAQIRKAKKQIRRWPNGKLESIKLQGRSQIKVAGKGEAK